MRKLGYKAIDIKIGFSMMIATVKDKTGQKKFVVLKGEGSDKLAYQ